jgi:short-subunit dehydrogenase
MGFEHTSVLITGASKGIGKIIAEVFAASTNHALVLVARSEQELEEVKEACLTLGAPDVKTIAADITNKNIQDIDFSGLNIGIVINNAGSFLFKPLQETTFEDFQSQMNINALGAFNVTSAILPQLKQQERGLIVNICSQASLKGLADSGAYSASKHATLGFSRSLRLELQQTNIAVTAINLGQTYSTSWDGVDIDPNELIDPKDVAQLIISFSKMSPRTVVEEILIKPQGGEVAPM